MKNSIHDATNVLAEVEQILEQVALGQDLRQPIVELVRSGRLQGVSYARQDPVHNCHVAVLTFHLVNLVRNGDAVRSTREKKAFEGSISTATSIVRRLRSKTSDQIVSSEPAESPAPDVRMFLNRYASERNLETEWLSPEHGPKI